MIFIGSNSNLPRRYSIPACENNLGAKKKNPRQPCPSPSPSLGFQITNHKLSHNFIQEIKSNHKHPYINTRALDSNL